MEQYVVKNTQQTESP